MGEYAHTVLQTADDPSSAVHFNYSIKPHLGAGYEVLVNTKDHSSFRMTIDNNYQLVPHEDEDAVFIHLKQSVARAISTCLNN